MCTEENNDKDKNLPLPTPPVTVFLIPEKLPSLRLWNFQTFS